MTYEAPTVIELGSIADFTCGDRDYNSKKQKKKKDDRPYRPTS